MALEPAVPLTKEPMMPFAEESPAEDSPLEVSVIMPCLNEADTLEDCIAKARKALHEHDIRGEIIVADNGSTDASPGIARRMGARVVHVEAKGYGNALMGGIAGGATLCFRSCSDVGSRRSQSTMFIAACAALQKDSTTV
jgi:glycosyltransferase involved in cell wall biosynthesis